MPTKSEYQAETFVSLARELEARAERIDKFNPVYSPEATPEFRADHDKKRARSAITYKRAAALLRENAS